jgi:hypothetical protein
MKPSIILALLKLNVDFDPMVIGADTRDSCLEKQVKGDPQAPRAKARLTEPLF